MAKKLEIEMKYLLKRLPPSLRYSKVLSITQYYLSDGSRIRMAKNAMKKDGAGVKYYHTKKKKIKMGVYEEDEKAISSHRFEALRKEAESAISKTRYVYNSGRLKWEIDVYEIKMVTAEIELPRENYPFRMPEAVRKELIMDVTEFPQFTSRRLSDPIT
jgi:CYTH domain-containing protein